MRIFSLSILLVFVFSCAQKQEEKKASLLGDFWKNEIARLNKEKPMITKISTVNGKTDTVVTDSIDWEKELQIFVKSDINGNEIFRYEKSILDSLNETDDRGLFHITKLYSAKDSVVSIRRILIDSLGSRAYYPSPYGMKEKRQGYFSVKSTAIEILVKNEQQLYSTYKKLKYNSSVGYEIIGSQDVKFLNGINYKVEVKFEE